MTHAAPHIVFSRFLCVNRRGSFGTSMDVRRLNLRGRRGTFGNSIDVHLC